MSRARPGLRFVVPVAAGLRETVEALRRQHAPDVPITLVDGRTHEALAACDVVDGWSMGPGDCGSRAPVKGSVWR